MKKILILVILLFGIQNLFSQKVEEFSVSGISEAIGLPFTNYLPYHSGLEIKGTFKKIEKSKTLQYINGNIGFFHHQKIELGFYIGGEYQFSKKLFNQKMSIDFPIGIGYLHTFYPGEVYEIINGELVEINQTGRAHLYSNLGIGLTYLRSQKVKPFIRQELFVEVFGNALPVIPHSFLKIGIQIKINTNEKH